MGAGDNGESAVRARRCAHVVVLTALEVEFRAVLTHLDGPVEVVEERGSRFEVGVFPDRLYGTGDKSVAVHMTGPGNHGAAAAVERAVALFAPEAVLFVGVAGGRKDVALGDVVAADSVYDYETGKDTEAGFVPRQKSFPCGHRLVQHARAVAAADRWQRRIGAAPEAARPGAHVKPIAAGGRVIAHPLSDAGSRLTRTAGDAVAVDMEAYGFLAGAYVNRSVDALVVRGVSDLLSDKAEAHDEVWQPVAARNAAAFAFELIHGLTVRRDRAEPRPAPAGAPWPTRPRRLPASELAGLASLLLAVPGLGSPSGWQQLLDELPTLGTAVARQQSLRQEALSLLRTCESHLAWSELADAVTLLAPEAPVAADLVARLGRLTG